MKTLPIIVLCVSIPAAGCSGKRDQKPDVEKTQYPNDVQNSAQLESGVPDDFLETSNGAWQQILESDVSGSFADAKISEVLPFLVQQVKGNMIIIHDSDRELPSVAKVFDAVPLRLVIFELANQFDADVSWELAPDGFPSAIRFVTK